MRKKSIIIGAVIGAVVVAAAGTVASRASASANSSAAAHVTTAGIVGPTTPSALPAFVSLPHDQADHLSSSSDSSEWWYTVGQVHVGNHRFGYLVDIAPRLTIAAGVALPPVAIISVTDMTTGQYVTKSFTYDDPGQTSFSATSLDASTPNASLSGPLNAMRLHASLPAQGSAPAATINLTLDAEGPTIYNGGTGLIPFAGGSSYYYSLPDLATTGTITESGKNFPVQGTSWLDHQWGDFALSGLGDGHWTWMGIHLRDGVSLDLADIFSASGQQNSFATVVEPSGEEDIVAVTPLAATTSGFVTSPTSGQRYGSRWVVNIPELHTSLTVRAVPALQEIGVSTIAAANEAASTVTGRYEGVPVTGQAEVEQLGNFRPSQGS
jgi:predicted secreted hydrolase